MDSGMNEGQAAVKAAERIRGGYPTYSYIPTNIRKLRRNPALGSFVSFPYEVVRTTKNNALYAVEDLQAGRTKMAMSDAQLMHAEKMARGEEAYQGKLLEARQNDYKDEFVLVIISAPIIVLMWAVMSDDPAAMDKVKLFFEYFQTLPKWFTNLWILVVASIFGIKGTQIFKGGKK